MATWSSSISLRGPAGQQLLFGQGSPSNSVGNLGDAYIDTSSGHLFAQKGSSGWPSTYANLACKDGATIRSGTGTPSSSNPATQNDNDYFLQTDGSPGLVLWGPRSSGAWPSSGQNLTGATGAAGNSITSGTAVPSSSYGNNGDIYIQLPSTLYQKNSNGTWVASGLIANTISYGTAVPGTNYGNSGDVYLQNSSGTMYLWQKSGLNWAQQSQLTGAAGSNGTNGLSVLTGSGAPASSLGAQGQAYVDTTGGYLYQKGASAWSSGVSLNGAAGLSVLTGSGAPASGTGSQSQSYIDTTNAALYVKGASAWSSGVTLVGPAGAVIYSGTGAPSSSNPGGTVTAGSFYIRTDATPNQLFGPYTTANGWPSTYTAMGGGSFQTSAGPPASSLGSVGDCCIDLTNSFFYPPKTSSGWTTTPINMIGPTGPSMQVQPSLGSFASAWAPNAILNGQTVNSSGVYALNPGTSSSYSLYLPFSSSLMGLQVTSYSASAGTFGYSFYDTTSAAAIYNTTIAKGTVSNLSFSSGQYPLTSGHSYTFVVNYSSSGAGYMSMTPIILQPATNGSSTSWYQAACTFTPGTNMALSTSANYLGQPGVPSQQWYYKYGYASYLYQVQGTVAGSGNVQFTLYNGTSSAILYTTPSITLTSTGQPFSFGPFGISTAYIPASASCAWYATGSGTMTSVNLNTCVGM